MLAFYNGLFKFNRNQPPGVLPGDSGKDTFFKLIYKLSIYWKFKAIYAGKSPTPFL